MDNQNNGVTLQKDDNLGMSAGDVATESYPGAANQLSTGTVTGTEMQNQQESNLKFCKFCGAKIHIDAILCTSCGRQVEQLQGANPSQQPQIVINNANTSTNTNTNVNTAVAGGAMGKKKSKWVCLVLWWFLGLVGGHKFYDGKIGTGLLYMFTGGLFVIGWIIDLFAILNRPNPYYVGY